MSKEINGWKIPNLVARDGLGRRDQEIFCRIFTCTSSKVKCHECVFSKTNDNLEGFRDLMESKFRWREHENTV